MGKLGRMRVAVIVADGFEQSELDVPVKALRDAGVTVDVLAPDEAHHDHIASNAHASGGPGSNARASGGAGSKARASGGAGSNARASGGAGGEVKGVKGVKGVEGNETGGVKPDRLLRDANAETYDGLLIPGGVESPRWMRASGPHLAWVRRMFERNKPVAAICHGPWLLSAADAVGGRVVTSHPDCRADLESAGARWVDQEVVVDRGLVTSRKPEDLPAFCRAYLQLLEREYTELASAPVTTPEEMDGGAVQVARATSPSLM